MLGAGAAAFVEGAEVSLRVDEVDEAGAASLERRGHPDAAEPTQTLQKSHASAAKARWALAAVAAAFNERDIERDDEGRREGDERGQVGIISGRHESVCSQRCRAVERAPE